MDSSSSKTNKVHFNHMSSGLPPSDPPSENTLTINISHEQLSILEDLGFEEVVSVAPTRLKEGDYAYDVAMDWKWAKVYYQQFKRPSDETGTIQNRKYTDGQVKFDVDSDQVDKLQKLYDEGVAFLTFPLVRSRDQMPGNLNQTIFVDVHGIKANDPTIAYIHDKWDDLYKSDLILPCLHKNYNAEIRPENSKVIKSYISKDRSIIPAVHVNADNGISTVHPDYIMKWGQLLSNLLSCDCGNLLRMSDDIGYIQNDEEESSYARAMVFGGEKLPNIANWQ